MVNYVKLNQVNYIVRELKSHMSEYNTGDIAFRATPDQIAEPVDATAETAGNQAAETAADQAPERAAEAADSDQLAELAAELHVGVMRLARRLRTETGVGLTSTQLSVMASLWREGARSLRQLADDQGVSPPAITRTVKVLEQHGLVTKHASPADARVIQVQMTKPGKRVFAEIRQARRHWLSQQLAELSTAERRTLAEASALLLAVASR